MKIVNFMLYFLMIIWFSACSQIIQDTLKNSKNYTLKYSHVTNEKIFLEEANELIELLPYKETFASSLNNLQELIDSMSNINIPDKTITFTCAFNVKQHQKLTNLLKTRKYPCDMEYAGYTIKSLTNKPYKELYGKKFEDIQNKEQFLLRYTKEFSNITNIDEVLKTIEKIYNDLNSNDNAIYDLRELKHYAFNHGIIKSYKQFYDLLTKYSIKCKNSLFETTLDKVVMQQNLTCKVAKQYKK